MRAFSAAAVSLIASLSLFGCDENPSQTQAPAAKVAAAPPPACNCKQTREAKDVAPAAHHHWRHHRAWSNGSSYAGSSSSYRERASYHDSDAYNGSDSDNDSSSYSEHPSSHSEPSLSYREHASSYSERSSSYSERSSSSVREYSPGDEERYSSDAGGEERTTQSASASAGVWIDGYGRAHYPDYGPLEDEHPGLISRGDERKRLHPWHGYDSDCDNGID